MSKAVSAPAGRRPITPLLLVILGVGLYFTGYLIFYAPKVVPPMVAMWSTMFGPLVCALLLGVWFVLQPLVRAIFRRRQPQPSVAVAAVTAGVGSHDHAGSTGVTAPGSVTSSAPAPFSLDPDLPPQPPVEHEPSALWTAVKRFAVAFVVACVCVGAMMATHANSKAPGQMDTRFFFTVWGLPLAIAAATVVAWLLYHATTGVRVAVTAVMLLAAITPWELVRMEGVYGKFGMNWVWRWASDPEDVVAEYEARGDSRSLEQPIEGQIVAGVDDWVGFRGPGRDGRAPAQRGTKLTEKWRRPVGPGWGSVSGVGDLLFTQEQRKESEVVVCYDLEQGKTHWIHEEAQRHDDGPAGPGPRGTPTFHEGKVYAMGGTGVLVCLDARSGKLDWKKPLKEILDVKQAVFGFACSPLVHKGKVYVHPGVEGPILVAFDAKTGEKAWTAGSQKSESYSSPQLATLAGVEQILVYGSNGVSGFDPDKGTQLWHYNWDAAATAQPSVQPTLLPGDRVLIGGAQPSTGFRCLEVTKSGDQWQVSEKWTTEEVSPCFNDVVYHEGHLYGLDSGRLFCLDAQTGELRWKTRGASAESGQVLLVGKKLLVQEERGRLAWYDATADSAPKAQFTEALKSKTWNHPSLVRGRLLVRNGKEMICFALTE